MARDHVGWMLVGVVLLLVVGGAAVLVLGPTLRPIVCDGYGTGLDGGPYVSPPPGAEETSPGSGCWWMP